MDLKTQRIFKVKLILLVPLQLIFHFLVDIDDLNFSLFEKRWADFHRLFLKFLSISWARFSDEHPKNVYHLFFWFFLNFPLYSYTFHLINFTFLFIRIHTIKHKFMHIIEELTKFLQIGLKNEKKYKGKLVILHVLVVHHQMSLLSPCLVSIIIVVKFKRSTKKEKRVLWVQCIVMEIYPDVKSFLSEKNFSVSNWGCTILIHSVLW